MTQEEESAEAAQAQSAQSAQAAELMAPFRPRRGRLVATALAVVVPAFFVLLAILMPADTGMTQWKLPDRVMLGAFGALLGVGFIRYASIRAVPSAHGLTVRNLIVTRELQWSEIVLVEMGEGDPWPTLDLADTDRVAVMAIQRADGAFGVAEGRRLATLVQDCAGVPDV